MTAAAREAAHEGGEQHDELWQRVGKVRIGMLTTLNKEGRLYSRPMTVQEIEPDGTLWFFLSGAGNVAEEIANDSRVNASFANPNDNFFLSVVGRAFAVDDRQKVEALWSPVAAAWFPGGPADPDLRLLRVDPQRVDYWTSAGGKLLQFLAMAKAAITRRPPEGEHVTFAPGTA